MTGEPSGEVYPLYEQRQRDDPSRACYVAVEAHSAEAILAHARLLGARFMEEPIENVYVASTTVAEPIRYHPFQVHLGIMARPVRWKMTCTVRLAHEVVDERRRNRAGSTEEVDERPDEETEEVDG